MKPRRLSSLRESDYNLAGALEQIPLDSRNQAEMYRVAATALMRTGEYLAAVELILKQPVEEFRDTSLHLLVSYFLPAGELETARCVSLKIKDHLKKANALIDIGIISHETVDFDNAEAALEHIEGIGEAVRRTVQAMKAQFSIPDEVNQTFAGIIQQFKGKTPYAEAYERLGVATGESRYIEIASRIRRREQGNGCGREQGIEELCHAKKFDQARERAQKINNIGHLFPALEKIAEATGEKKDFQAILDVFEHYATVDLNEAQKLSYEERGYETEMKLWQTFEFHTREVLEFLTANRHFHEANTLLRIIYKHHSPLIADEHCGYPYKNLVDHGLVSYFVERGEFHQAKDVALQMSITCGVESLLQIASTDHNYLEYVREARRMAASRDDVIGITAMAKVAAFTRLPSDLQKAREKRDQSGSYKYEPVVSLRGPMNFRYLDFAKITRERDDFLGALNLVKKSPYSFFRADVAIVMAKAGYGDEARIVIPTLDSPVDKFNVFITLYEAEKAL